ncbi:MAG TPA: hypothetical protein VM734_01730 [Kofleriaceae bacterium]|nr:hypothetical protein [Kofleriaceae bacterium]
MNRSLSSLALVGVLGLLATGCPGGDDDPGGANPDQLWLALDGSEVQVKLVGVQPPYY